MFYSTVLQKAGGLFLPILFSGLLGAVLPSVELWVGDRSLVGSTPVCPGDLPHELEGPEHAVEVGEERTYAQKTKDTKNTKNTKNITPPIYIRKILLLFLIIMNLLKVRLKK